MYLTEKSKFICKYYIIFVQIVQCLYAGKYLYLSGKNQGYDL